MKYVLTVIFLAGINILLAQVAVDLKNYTNKNGAQVKVNKNKIFVSWPAGKNQKGHLELDLSNQQPLFTSIGLIKGGAVKQVAKNLDPVFVLTVGKRDLVSQNGWNIFFDKVPLKPHQSHVVDIDKKSASVHSAGARTVVSIGEIAAPGFTGTIEITVYNGSPLFNVAAAMATMKDSTAIVYDAGLISKQIPWQNISWADVTDQMQSVATNIADSSHNTAVKYRSIFGVTKNGSLAVFPAPHQYFYPLDEAFNLKFTWYGNNYRNMVDGYGIGIRQDLFGDKRYVPWFNAPPGTRQRLNFFCLISEESARNNLQQLKKFTHDDKYVPLAGYKTMSSHFHNEFVMKVVLANKPIPDTPNFKKVFENMGMDIVHLGEFHYTAHPKGPDEQRLTELNALFEQCKRLSSDKFLLLPGEEPNEFLGGHWMQFFPKPVYWIMSRKEGDPFVSQHPKYGTVYRVANATEMLELLKIEKGLAWTAHARTKGSTGYPDKYKDEPFFKSDRFFGAAWKAMPADLSQPKLGNDRVLGLMDDMNNWGANKKVIAEADLFTIEPENEMYAHMNVNYLQLNKLPSFGDGWQSVFNVLENGKFFSSTGEVLIPSFTVNNKVTGETVTLDKNKANVSFKITWTYPLHFAELISGDGTQVFRHKINLDNTLPFGEKVITQQLDLSGRKWIRLEVWDVAANGAFTQTVWLK